MHRLNRKNLIELGAMTVIFILAVILVYKTTILTRMVMPKLETQVRSNGTDYYVLSDGDHIEQTFLYPSDELLSVGMKITLKDDVITHYTANEADKELGYLHLDILDEGGSAIMHADYDVRKLADGQNLLASFPDGRQTGWNGRRLTIVLDAEDICEEVGLSIGYCTKVKDTSLAVNGEQAGYTLNIRTSGHQFFYWRKWMVFGAALIYLMLAGTYLGFAVFHLKPEQVFLFAGSLLAVLYLLLLPPMSVPDELDHFKKAYSYANQLIGEEPEQAGNIVMDIEDINALEKFGVIPSLSEYDDLKDEIWRIGRVEGTEEIGLFDTQAKAITYLPGMLGIILGRLMGLSGIHVIILGRLFAIGFYLAAMYWFIRLMPFAKSAAFIMAILPMTIQQCCSYSYDAVVIETAFLYFAVLFGLLYKNNPIQKKQIVLYVVFMIILSISKGGTYMPLCLLTMMIPAARFRDTRRKWIFVGCMAAVAVASFLISTLSYALYVASPQAQAEAGAYLAGKTYGVAGLLENPMLFVTLTLRTLFYAGDGYMEMMFGSQLGWLSVSVSRIVIYGMFLLMILCVLPVEDRSEEIDAVVTKGQKVFYLTVGALSVLMVCVAMFMSWTPKEALDIQGIQGRYFLPCFPGVLLAFRSRNIALKKNISRCCMFLAVSLQCVAIYDILLSLERVL